MIIVIDDERTPNFECTLVKTETEALELLTRLHDHGERIDELWLDYSLGGSGDVFAILTWMEQIAIDGVPLDVGKVFAHAGSSGRLLIKEVLQKTYAVEMRDLPVTT